MKKLCLFDLDGTLLDTVPEITYYINCVLDLFSLPRVDKNTVIKGIGKDVVYMFDTCTGISDINKIKPMTAVFEILYRAGECAKTFPYDGIKEVVQNLVKKGYVCCILTNKTSRLTHFLEQNQLKEFGFNEAIADGDGYGVKPNTNAVTYLMQKYGIDKENTYMIGDGEADILTSINAKINGIGVLWGYRTKEDLQKVGGKVFAKSPKELEEIIG